MTTHPEPTASQPAPERSIRLTRPSVVVLCGPAACGKSTFAARHFRPTQIISSDRARALVCDDERDQRFSAEAFALVDYIVEQRLRINRLSVVDSTALTVEARKSLLDLARKHAVPGVVFFFDIPLETCIARDRARERSVGQSVIERQYHLFTQQCGSIEREGFDQIIRLHEDDLDKLRIDVLFRPVPKPSGVSERGDPRRAAFQGGRPSRRSERSYGARRSSDLPAQSPRPVSSVPQPATGSASPRPGSPGPESPSSQLDSPAPDHVPPQGGSDPSSESS